MIRKSYKPSVDTMRWFLQCDFRLRPVISSLSRVRRSCVMRWRDLMFGYVQPNPAGFQGIAHLLPMGDDK